jgi:predicted metal-dependent hydrolase
MQTRISVDVDKELWELLDLIARWEEGSVQDIALSALRAHAYEKSMTRGFRRWLRDRTDHLREVLEQIEIRAPSASK